MKKTKWTIAQLMQLTNQSNMLSDSHLENPENPFCWKSFFNPSFPAPLSLSSRSSVLLSRFFSLQRILPTATRFPLFHPAPAAPDFRTRPSFLPSLRSPLPFLHFMRPFSKKKLSRFLLSLSPVPLSLLIFPRFFPLKSPAASRPLHHFQSHPLP